MRLAPRPSRLDAALATAVCAELVLEMLLTNQRSGALAPNIIAALALGAPLFWRRTAPLATVAAVGVVVTLMSATLTRAAMKMDGRIGLHELAMVPRIYRSIF